MGCTFHPFSCVQKPAQPHRKSERRFRRSTKNCPTIVQSRCSRAKAKRLRTVASRNNGFLAATQPLRPAKKNRWRAVLNAILFHLSSQFRCCETTVTKALPDQDPILAWRRRLRPTTPRLVPHRARLAVFMHDSEHRLVGYPKSSDDSIPPTVSLFYQHQCSGASRHQLYGRVTSSTPLR